MRQGRNKGSPPLGEKVRRTCALCLASLTAMLTLAGCKANPTELRGKTSFGPEFQNRGNNTSQIRYDARQAVELKWDNGWTTGLSFRRRDIDNGSGDNENRIMAEVGYPLWKAPKKEDKATDRRIQQLQEQVEEMQSRVAQMKTSVDSGTTRVAGSTSPGQ